ncbi:MAG: SDR family oxidoreductase [Acidimicrobiales bacterium]
MTSHDGVSGTHRSRHRRRRGTAEPAEIAGCIAFLAGPDAMVMTGANLVVDGGGSAVDLGTLAYKDLPNQ